MLRVLTAVWCEYIAEDTSLFAKVDVVDCWVFSVFLLSLFKCDDALNLLTIDALCIVVCVREVVGIRVEEQLLNAAARDPRAHMYSENK